METCLHACGMQRMAASQRQEELKQRKSKRNSGPDSGLFLMIVKLMEVPKHSQENSFSFSPFAE